MNWKECEENIKKLIEEQKELIGDWEVFRDSLADDITSYINEKFVIDPD